VGTVECGRAGWREATQAPTAFADCERIRRLRMDKAAKSHYENNSDYALALTLMAKIEKRGQGFLVCNVTPQK